MCGKGNDNYRLVFMDCNMPLMDGLEAARRIREDPAYHSMVIVALTAYAENSFKEECIKAGMDLFLTKPVSKDAVQTILLD